MSVIYMNICPWIFGWVFLLVPAHPGRPGQRAIKRLLCCCCVCPFNLSLLTVSVCLVVFQVVATRCCWITCRTWAIFSRSHWLTKVPRELMTLSQECMRMTCCVKTLTTSRRLHHSPTRKACSTWLIQRSANVSRSVLLTDCGQDRAVGQLYVCVPGR